MFECRYRFTTIVLTSRMMGFLILSWLLLKTRQISNDVKKTDKESNFLLIGYQAI